MHKCWSVSLCLCAINVGFEQDSVLLSAEFTLACLVSNTGSKPFRQLGTNRCLRGFINMSSFESLSVCANHTTCKSGHGSINTYPYFPRQDFKISHTHILYYFKIFKIFLCKSESDTLPWARFCNTRLP